MPTESWLTRLNQYWCWTCGRELGFYRPDDPAGDEVIQAHLMEHVARGENAGITVTPWREPP